MKLIIAADYDPRLDKWTGLAIEQGNPGTHRNYNVVYNGQCCSEYFDTEHEAKEKAKIESNKSWKYN